MKGFEREDLLFSLCGLNCGLCPMKLDGYCPGCGRAGGHFAEAAQKTEKGLKSGAGDTQRRFFIFYAMSSSVRKSSIS